MHTHPYDILPLRNNANFIFTPCPGTKNVDLQTSVEQLKQAGAQAIITLMYDTELAHNHAEELSQICRKKGINWFQLPLANDDVPNEDFRVAFESHLPEILTILNGQGSVAVHCKGGSGRTGLAIGLLMYQLGYEKSEVVKRVQQIRPKAFNHPEHISFFQKFQKVGAK